MALQTTTPLAMVGFGSCSVACLAMLCSIFAQPPPGITGQLVACLSHLIESSEFDRPTGAPHAQSSPFS
jgi:CBS-domain-containing membrane protein